MATNKQTHTLYDGTVEVTFYPDSHKYQLKGEKTFLISATAITGVIDKSRMLIPWATGLAATFLIDMVERGEPITTDAIREAMTQHTIRKDEAASIGTIVHDYAEAFATAKIEGKPLPEIPADAPEAALNGIMAFIDWTKQHHVEFRETERLVYSKAFGYVGLTDAIAVVDGKLSVIDYKTSKGIYDDHYFQIAGYWAAYTEETAGDIQQGILLHFNKETGEFAAHVIEAADNLKNFGAFLGLYNAKKRLKELQKNYYPQK